MLLSHTLKHLPTHLLVPLAPLAQLAYQGWFAVDQLRCWPGTGRPQEQLRLRLGYEVAGGGQAWARRIGVTVY